MDGQSIDVSIVIACYNEMQTIEKNVSRIEDIMCATRYSYEIILYDDGSTDGTRDIGPVLAAKSKNIVWKEHEKNCGRGKTVSDGLKLAKGRISGFLDMDLEVPAEYILPLILEIENGYDVAVAWRMEHSDMQSLPFYKKPYAWAYWVLRFIMSSGYSFLVNFLLGVKFHDTEVGFKFFNHKKILPLLDEIEDNHWFWDTEIMVRASRKGFKIKEYPALFLKNLEKKSTVKPVRDSIFYFRKLLKFRNGQLQK